MLRRILFGLLTAAAVGAGPTAHAFAFSGGVAHVVTHPIAVSAEIGIPTDPQAAVRLDTEPCHHVGGHCGHAR